MTKKRKPETTRSTPAPFEYLGYSIGWRKGKHVAKLADENQLAPREIRSLNLSRLHQAIEAIAGTADLTPALRANAEILPYPKWLRIWLKRPTIGIDLDQAYRTGAC